MLTIAYCSLFASADSRRKHLRETYHFVCTCHRCTRQDGAPHVLPLAKHACATAAAARVDARCWPEAAAAARALEEAVAPLLVHAGADWARLTLCRARWTQLQTRALQSGVGATERTQAADLAADLAALLGSAHPFAQRVRAFADSQRV